MSVGNRTQAETASSRGYTLIDVLEPENVAAAWKKVKANKDKPGIDGMEVEDFCPRSAHAMPVSGFLLRKPIGMRSINRPAHSDFVREHWEKIRAKLEDGSYKPSPVRRVEIPKDGGGKRALGIPTVLDRMIQQAIAQVLTPLYDPSFSESSFGFRPMRSAHDAITVMAAEARKIGSRCHVVDCDLEKFFDTVDSQKLMGRLRQRITDPKLLALILKYLKAGAISRQGHFEEQLMGVPQGGPLSPLLANVLLDELDVELERRGHKFVRYADDCAPGEGAPKMREGPSQPPCRRRLQTTASGGSQELLS